MFVYEVFREPSETVRLLIRFGNGPGTKVQGLESWEMSGLRWCPTESLTFVTAGRGGFYEEEVGVVGESFGPTVSLRKKRQ